MSNIELYLMFLIIFELTALVYISVNKAKVNPLFLGLVVLILSVMSGIIFEVNWDNVEEFRSQTVTSKMFQFYLTTDVFLFKNKPL